MLRALRPARPALAWRRLVAALLAVVLGMGCAEPLLADTCDGDAPRAAVGALLPHVDGLTVVAAQPAGTGDVVAAGAPDGPERDGGTPRHAVHVCHCTHAHGGALTPRDVVHAAAGVGPVARAVTVRSDRLPPSPALEPPLRPPVLPRPA